MVRTWMRRTRTPYTCGLIEDLNITATLWVDEQGEKRLNIH
jgi:hypothetical protein